MNDRLIPHRASAPSESVDLVLPQGTRLGPFEVQRLVARGTSSFVYLATDHALAMPVAIQEYLPSHMVKRDAWLHLRASDPWNEDPLSRGMHIFIEESRLLARCEHPALVRVNHLFEANGTAYRVMPFHPGQRLSELRPEMTAAPDEASLRALLEPLLGALEVIHRLGQVHGGVSASNILLIDGDFPLLLAAGGAANETRSDLVESLMATVESQPGVLLPDQVPAGATADLCALGDVIRYCITATGASVAGGIRSREPLSIELSRPVEGSEWPAYSTEFLSTLDAATSPYAEDWPNSVDQFRLWLAHGAPRARAMAPRLKSTAPGPTADDPFGHPDEPFFFTLNSPGSQGSPSHEPEGARAPVALEDSPLRPPAAARKRWRGLPAKVLFGGVLAASAVGIITWVSGAWTITPAIPLDHETALPVARLAAPPARARTPEPPPAPAPAPQAQAPETPVAPAPLAEPLPDPGRMVANEPPGAGPSARVPARHVKPTPAKPRPTRVAAKGPTDPRSECAGRSEFALYRCMVQKCQTARWQVHPQCVRLRQSDRVD